MKSFYIKSEIVWDNPSEPCTIEGVNFSVKIVGKIDNAQIPKNLLKHMEEKYPAEKVYEAIGLKKFIPINEWKDHKWVDGDGNPDEKMIPSMYTIYGEGYGEGIQFNQVDGILKVVMSLLYLM